MGLIRPMVMASLLVAAPAQAALIDVHEVIGGRDVTLLRDAATGFDWVPLEYTRGTPETPIEGSMSAAEFLAGERGFLAAGFRIPTYSDVLGLLAHAGVDVSPGVHIYPAGAGPEIIRFGWNVAGACGECPDFAWVNFTSDNDPLVVGYASWASDWRYDHALGRYALQDETTLVAPQYDGPGSAALLVRGTALSTVPEPGSAILLAAGLALLARTSRIAKAS